MEDLAERSKRKSVVHYVFDDRHFTILVEAVGVPPETIGTVHLLVYEP